MKTSITSGLLVLAGALPLFSVGATEDSDRQAVAALDTEFQAAVKNNAADTMARILHDDMVLVLGDGRVSSRKEELQDARDKLISYEHHEEDDPGRPDGPGSRRYGRSNGAALDNG